MEVDVELLTAMKKVPARETDLHLRTIAATGSSNGVGLNIEVVGLFERTGQSEVKGVGLGPGFELEVGTTEHACGIDLIGRFYIPVIVELLTWSQPEIP